MDKRKGGHVLEGLEDQIALGEVEDKGLDHLEHAGGGEFQIIHAMKGGRMKKVRVEPEKGNNIEGGGEIYRRVLRVLLALIMETRRGTEESPRELCEILSSTRPVNEAINRGRMMRRGKEGRKERKEKQTQGFAECGEVGVGEGEGRDLRDGDELFGDGGGEHSKRSSGQWLEGTLGKGREK